MSAQPINPDKPSNILIDRVNTGVERQDLANVKVAGGNQKDTVVVDYAGQLDIKTKGGNDRVIINKVNLGSSDQLSQGNIDLGAGDDFVYFNNPLRNNSGKDGDKYIVKGGSGYDTAVFSNDKKLTSIETVTPDSLQNLLRAKMGKDLDSHIEVTDATGRRYVFRDVEAVVQGGMQLTPGQTPPAPKDLPKGNGL